MEDEEVKRRVLSELKGYCLDVLGCVQNPRESNAAARIHQFLHFLRVCPSNMVQPILDYALFPLLLLLDASVDSRSSSTVNSSEVIKLDRVSDIVAEGVLQCLEELLKKCQLRSSEQMVVVLKKLTAGALLGPSEASEEFREGIIRCFRAVLLNLRQCSVDSCTCKQSSDPALLASKDMQALSITSSIYEVEPKECLLAFLQSQAASAAIGHWLSLLLKAADIEATRGLRGSAKLRVEAFLTFRILVAKIGIADALAFFLPGIVSQLAKVLNVSRAMISGAAGRSEAIDHATKALAEFLMIVLADDANLSELDLPFHPNEVVSSNSLLEELRELPIYGEGQSEVENSSSEVLKSVSVGVDLKERKRSEFGDMLESLHVNRTKDWLKKTSGHVNKLLCATFPHVCVHPVAKVRGGLLAGIQGLLSKCCYTLKESRMVLLECLCVLVCDDSEEVSADAQKFLECLLSSSEKHRIDRDVAEMFSRLLEKLPKVMLGSEESFVLSHAQQLLAVIYYSGPQLLVDHLLHSSIIAARFLDIFALCLSQNLVYSGSLQKLLTARPFPSTGYLQSVGELKSSFHRTVDVQAMNTADFEICEVPVKDVWSRVEGMQMNYELPHIPPWFVDVGSQKLYQALAGVLRLVGLSTLIGDSKREGHLSVITDIPLGYFRKLVAEIRARDHNNEGWQSWYYRTGSGQLLRQASTAACILNEMIFGLSSQSVDSFTRMFQKSRKEVEDEKECESAWKCCLKEDARIQLINCVGSILHEYLSPELWDLPIDRKSALQQLNGETESITQHFIRDSAMLHQVIIDGIGIFYLCLGKDFDSSGFLHSSLYLLLENLICSDFQIRSAADAVLRIVCETSGYQTVGHLVMANSDYIIDSLCRQLRHLDLNRHVPNLLGAILSYIGVAHKILPLLEEPMHSVSLELEILGRHRHPDMTVPFLKAVAEIAKSSKCEASSVVSECESYFRHVETKLSDLENKALEKPCQSCSNDDEYIDLGLTESDLVRGQVAQLESMLFKLKNCREYRRTVGSIAGSCLTAATPLLASQTQSACLVALDIVEDGIATLAKVEEAYQYEKETKEAFVRVIKSCSFHHFQDTLDAAEDGTDENRSLPAMNRIWPFLIACVRSSNPVVICRCSGVVSTVVKICGGDFFSRRFHTDGPHFWKLLSTSPFQRKPISTEEKGRLRLPYRSSAHSSEDSVAEVSNLKVQVAVLGMIADISQSKRSASAISVVLKKVSGLVVGIAFSGVSGLRDAAVKALVGLASVDPDLIWLLIADVYYTLKKKRVPLPPNSDFPEISQILPPPLCLNGYLYAQYGGQTFGFDIDLASVETVFKKLHSQVFILQLYS